VAHHGSISILWAIRSTALSHCCIRRPTFTCRAAASGRVTAHVALDLELLLLYRRLAFTRYYCYYQYGTVCSIQTGVRTRTGESYTAQ